MCDWTNNCDIWARYHIYLAEPLMASRLVNLHIQTKHIIHGPPPPPPPVSSPLPFPHFKTSAYSSVHTRQTYSVSVCSRRKKMINVLKTPPADAQPTPPTTKATPELENGTMITGPPASSRIGKRQLPRNYDIMHLALRLVCLSASVASVVVMTTAKERSTISLYGFDLPVYSKWSFSDSFNYLVGVSASVAVHSLLQLLMISRMLLKKSSIISSRNHAWLIFAADQVFAYAMMSAGSAASGVTNLNRTGIKHSSLPNFCKPLHSFCDRVALSIAFTFFSCFLLAMSVVLDVVWLSEC